MWIAYKGKKKGAQNERLNNRWCYMLIVGNHHLLADAAYIAAWMIDCCNLIGRKVVLGSLELVFEAVFTIFSQWIRTKRKYCILNEVHLSSIRLQRYKIPWCFRQECQLNARCSHEIWLLTKREKLSWSLFLFFPLFDLTLLPVYIIMVIKVKLRVVHIFFFWQAKYLRFSSHWIVT